MINAFFVFLLSQVILIPIAVGLVRFKRIDKIYYPYFILLVLGFVAELVSFILIKGFKFSNAPVNNIYSLLQCCLIIYQLYLWKNSKKTFKSYVFLMVVCVVMWLIQNILFLKISTFDSPYFTIFYAFAIVLISINHINIIMMRLKSSLLKNPQIIICVAFITFFIYQIIYEASMFISVEPATADELTFGFAFINFATNTLFAIAICFITAKNGDDYERYFGSTKNKIV